MGLAGLFCMFHIRCGTLYSLTFTQITAVISGSVMYGAVALFKVRALMC